MTNGKRGVLRLPGAVARSALHPRVLRTGAGARAWRFVVSAPGLSDSLRFRIAQRVRDGLDKANRPEGAVLTLSSAARRTSSARHRADLLGDAARLELLRGRPPRALTAAVSAELVCADAQLAAGEATASAASVVRALRLAFHRVLHFDRTTSPLAQDPGAYLAPVHASAAVRALTEGAGRSAEPADPPTDRPLRLLFVTRGNANFLRQIRDHYRAHPKVEVRCLDLADEPALDELANSLTRMAAHRLGDDAEFGRQAEELLRPHLDWADTVFVDWCVGPAALVTSVDPGSTRIVVRLHSAETFSLWPFLVDFSRVDDLVFVGAHLRDLTVAVVPQLASTGQRRVPRLHVIANAMDLAGQLRHKADEARFTLGVTGISSVAKDPRWAIEVLRILRAQDPRYRLLLIGEDVDAKLSAAARAYARRYRGDLAELEPSGAVRRLGQLDDVPAALTEVGVILSSSVRESFHCGFVEGAASGAVPVGRDWPFFAGKANGARTLFPADWVVASPEEAAERILKVTATPESWRKAGEAASAHAMAAWDWTVVREEFDRLLLP
ncbi:MULTISPECIES: glycosyltransferase family 1 protein [unclassified Streptomyces]|uniref:glycosyltransferase family 1 protein n=1 Tax=unclassified Streptomyces TaxID=2593676 RepID=UPI000ADC99B8|nr:glycosyltransferase family 1 protein [Streptomyces sp. Root1310]